ncbi:MAG: AI-2E family transporter [Anaerofustis sp.]
MNRKIFKHILYLITAAAILAAMVVKIDAVWEFFGNLLNVITPLFIGIGIAFVLNRPYCFFRRLFQGKLRSEKLRTLMKGLAVLSVYLLFFGVVAGIFAFVIPQLAQSVAILSSNMDDYARSLSILMGEITDFLSLQQIDLSNIESYLQSLLSGAGEFLTVLMPQIFSFTAGLFSSVFNTILGLIISVYLLVSKEKIMIRTKKMIYAYLPKAKADRVSEIGKMTSETFSGFITGQLTEALILGILCFIGMLILGFEYPLFISTIISVTSIIPMIGPVIGCIPAVLILLLVDPMMALWFIVFIIVLQQIESNTFYPKVVGDSVGLPAVLVILAVIVGGGLGGIIGMLVGVPTASVIYRLVKEDADRRLEMKQLAEQ